MAKLKWFGGKDNVDSLVARGKLDRAIQMLEAQLKEDPRSVACRQQLGDILGRAGHKDRAIAVLAPLIDEFAADGFTAKAIAVVKKLERMDPERVDTSMLFSRIQRTSEAALPQPFVPVHIEADTDTFEPIQMTKDRPVATSSVDSDWFKEMQRPNFGWSPLLEGLPAEALDEVVGRLNLIVKNPGAIITGQGEAASSIFVLASGFARAYRRSSNQRYRQVLVFEEGQFFGEEAIMGPDPVRPITVTAASQCELLEVDLESLNDVIAANPNARQHLEQAHDRRSWVV